MDAVLDQKEPDDAAATPNSSNELVKLICKLRWIGMEEEAERLLAELEQRRNAPADDVFATSGDTD